MRNVYLAWWLGSVVALSALAAGCTDETGGGATSTGVAGSTAVGGAGGTGA
ncbi:MAG: hypothetical protein JRI23_24505, partial [Deltaproteobacteria bacterium]|nr:hypothetical protein [Deltaproteobacteria bacterium]MBW2535168.1 hypothetical protein [Deltaproteobacteria bacterium]